MRARRLDRWFDRYRRRGDVGALARVFDETAPELYRVAVHLARDLHTAEDLVQATFLAAIESREAYDERRELLPWLLGILARKAAEERRRARRPIEPDRIEPRAVEDPATGIESAELSSVVESALARLSAPYREVLEAHLRHGKSPQEIALALGRAPGTVRVQLHRGLEMLRRALPAGIAVGGLLGLSPRGLEVVRHAVVSAAGRTAASISSGATAAGLVGGIVMSTKAWIVAAAVVAGLAWFGMQARQKSPEPVLAQSPPAVVPAPAPVAPRASHPELARTEEDRVDRLPIARAPEVQPPVDTSVSGRLLRPDGSPASGVFVALVRRTEGIPRETIDEGETSTDGSFRLRGDPGPALVVGLAEGLLPVSVPVTLLAATELRLEPASFAAAAHIRGRVRFLGASAPEGTKVWAVLRADGSTLSLHEISLVWSEERLLLRSGVAETGSDGRFALEGLEPRLHQVEVMSTPGARVLRATREIPAPTDWIDLDVDFARLVVRVQSDGRPLEAKVNLYENRRGNGSIWGFGGQSTIDVLVPPASPWEVEALQPGYSGASASVVAPGPGETLERVLELTRKSDRAELVIRLETPDGRTIQEAGFGLVGTSSGSEWDSRIVRKAANGKAPSVVRNLQGEDNTFRLRDLPPDRYEVTVLPEGTWEEGSSYWVHDPLEVDLAPNSVAVHRIELRPGGRIRVQCGNRGGTWLGARCEVRDAFGAIVPVTFYTRDEKGSIWLGGDGLNASAPRGANDTFPNLPPGRYAVRLFEEGYVEATRDVVVEAGKTTELSVVLENR